MVYALIPVHRRPCQADLGGLGASLVHMRLCLTKEGREGGKGGRKRKKKTKEKGRNVVWTMEAKEIKPRAILLENDNSLERVLHIPHSPLFQLLSLALRSFSFCQKTEQCLLLLKVSQLMVIVIGTLQFHMCQS